MNACEHHPVFIPYGNPLDNKSYRPPYETGTIRDGVGAKINVTIFFSLFLGNASKTIQFFINFT